MCIDNLKWNKDPSSHTVPCISSLYFPETLHVSLAHYEKHSISRKLISTQLLLHVRTSRSQTQQNSIPCNTSYQRITRNTQLHRRTSTSRRLSNLNCCSYAWLPQRWSSTIQDCASWKLTSTQLLLYVRTYHNQTQQKSSKTIYPLIDPRYSLPKDNDEYTVLPSDFHLTSTVKPQ
jgi:hypothetical protein